MLKRDCDFFLGFGGQQLAGAQDAKVSVEGVELALEVTVHLEQTQTSNERPAKNAKIIAAHPNPSSSSSCFSVLMAIWF
jgi:hypothetical protein